MKKPLSIYPLRLPRSVKDEIVPAMWKSLSIVVGGLALLMLFVIPIAALSAARPGSWFDRVTASLLLVGVCTHPLVVGLILQSVQRRWTHGAPISTRFIPGRIPARPSLLPKRRAASA